MIDLPQIEGGWRCILADPPWHFKTYGAAKTRRAKQIGGVVSHYQTMTPAEIVLLPVAAVAAKDAHLFLWTTGPHLFHAADCMKAWGFSYSGIAFTWVKMKRSIVPNQLRMLATAADDLHTGMGYTTRKNAEFCLLARRGAARREAKDVREIIMSPVREHSRKPDEAYTRIERYCVGPRLELFGRQSRPGWTVWGNETTKFDRAAE